MHKHVLNSVVKISMMFAKYFEYYTIILRGAVFSWTHCIYNNNNSSHKTADSKAQSINISCSPDGIIIHLPSKNFENKYNDNKIRE